MEKVGYMGVPGSFSELAAERIVAQAGMKHAVLVPLVCAQNILDALRDGSISYGLLGVDNSSVGPVMEFVEAFSGVEYTVLEEYVLPIHHCLFKKKGADSEKLTHVASHPHALMQTERTRAERYPHLIEEEIEDTAIGAEWLAKGKLPDTTAVICSSNGGRLWDLDLIEENIEDFPDNRTTFRLLRLPHGKQNTPQASR